MKRNKINKFRIKKLFFFLVTAIILLNMVLVLGQETASYFFIEPDYVAIDVGEEVSINVGLYIDIDEGQKVQGLSCGLCHDSDILEISSFRCTPCSGVCICFPEPCGPGCCARNQRVFLEKNGITTGFPIFDEVSNNFEWFFLCIKYKGKRTGKTDLHFCDGLGSPPIITSIMIDGKNYRLNNFYGKILVGDVDNDGLSGKKDNCPEIYNPDQKDFDSDGIGDMCEPFIRGDVNNDHRVDIGDPIFILSYLFGGGIIPTCMDAADVNDDGKVDIADSVYLLDYLFSGGPKPSAPFEDDGTDLTEDLLECKS